MNADARYRILNRDELLARAERPTEYDRAFLVVMSLDEETSWESEPLPHANELPASVCGWRLDSASAFLRQGARFSAETVEATIGDDTLQIEFLDRLPGQRENPREGLIDIVDGVRMATHVLLRGEIRAVVGANETNAIAAHYSSADTVGCSFVTISPNSDDRSTHPRLPDGRRIAGISCEGLPPILLRYLATRQVSEVVPPSIVRMPLPSAPMLPNIPTTGERKRGRRIGKLNAIPFEKISADLHARRQFVSVVVKLDEESMRLADSSHATRKTQHRQSALQLRFPYPVEATTEAEVATAVQQQLQHFDTDYLLSFDAVTSLLADTGDESMGVALDETLQRKVVAMRFGDTESPSAAQRQRVRDHFATLMRVRVEVVPQNGNTKVFRGAILLKTGEVVDLGDGTVEPLKVGDRVMLNPDLYRAIVRKGKGMFVDARYFQLDPYRQDWHLRIYRYLASRWSANSTKLAAADWTVRLQLHTMLDMAGVDWRTAAHGTYGRGEPAARRRVEDAIGDLQRDGMIGAWRIVGEDMNSAATIEVEVPDPVRRRIVASRPGLHADAASGALAERSKAALAAKLKRTQKRARKP